MKRRSNVKAYIKNFVVACSNDEENQKLINNLNAIIKTSEWQFVIKFLWSIKNQMAMELLESDSFTEDSKEEKDITQRTYHGINEIIDFLVNPRKWVEKKGLFQMFMHKFKPDLTDEQRGRIQPKGN